MVMDLAKVAVQTHGEATTAAAIRCRAPHSTMIHDPAVISTSVTMQRTTCTVRTLVLIRLALRSVSVQLVILLAATGKLV